MYWAIGVPFQTLKWHPVTPLLQMRGDLGRY